jgi:hypothetical protein
VAREQREWLFDDNRRVAGMLPPCELAAHVLCHLLDLVMGGDTRTGASVQSILAYSGISVWPETPEYRD